MNAQPEPTSQPISDRSHAEALHVLQDVQENIRDAKRSQWKTTNYALALYAALVAAQYRIGSDVTIKWVAIVFAILVFGIWSHLICQFNRDLENRRTLGRRLQIFAFSEAIKDIIKQSKSADSTNENDAPILTAMRLVSLGGMIVALCMIWRS